MMFIPFGEIGLGKLTEKEKRAFVAFVGKELNKDERVEIVDSNQIVKNGLGWETISHASDAIQVGWFLYTTGKGTPKTLRYFFDLAKKWTKKNNIKYDEEEIAKLVEFMEKNK